MIKKSDKVMANGLGPDDLSVDAYNFLKNAFVDNVDIPAHVPMPLNKKQEKQRAQYLLELGYHAFMQQYGKSEEKESPVELEKSAKIEEEENTQLGVDAFEMVE